MIGDNRSIAPRDSGGKRVGRSVGVLSPRRRTLNLRQGLLLCAWLGAWWSPLDLRGAESRPVAPAPAVSEGASAARAGSSEGTIGPEGGTLVTDDGVLEVTWEPNAAREPARSRIASVVAANGMAISAEGPRGPVTITWFPPRALLPPPEPPRPGPQNPPPPPPAEPTVTIEEGNGEWIDVEPTTRADGGRQVKKADNGAPIKTKAAIRPLFVLMPAKAFVRLGGEQLFYLKNGDYDAERAAADLEEAAKPPAPTPAPKPPTPTGDPDIDDLAPLAPSRPATATSGTGAAGSAGTDDDLAPIAPSRAQKLARERAEQAAKKQKDKRDEERRRARVLGWTVNGLPNGDPEIGIIKLVTPERGLVFRESADYFAPKTTPSSGREVRVRAHVESGAKTSSALATVTLLGEGEVGIEVHGQLMLSTEIFDSKSTEGVKSSTTLTQKFEARIDGRYVGLFSEAPIAGGMRVLFRARTDTLKPMAGTVHDDLTRVWDEMGPGEYGERGQTDTVTGTGHADLPPLGSLTLDTKTGRWELGGNIGASWFAALRRQVDLQARIVERPSGATRTVSRPPGVDQVTALFNELPNVASNASVRDDPAMREWNGSIEKSWQLVGGRATYKLSWTINR